MGNIRIKLGSTKKINNVNVYSDVDVDAKYLENTLYDRAAVRSSLKNILTWKPYERILNPSFGNVLWDKLFDNIGSMTKNNIVDMVRRMLSSEPRIRVETVDVSTDAAANEVVISFTYSIPELDDTLERYDITIEKQ